LKSGYSLNYYFILQTDSSGGKNHRQNYEAFLIKVRKRNLKMLFKKVKTLTVPGHQ